MESTVIICNKLGGECVLPLFLFLSPLVQPTKQGYDDGVLFSSRLISSPLSDLFFFFFFCVSKEASQVLSFWAASWPAASFAS